MVKVRYLERAREPHNTSIDIQYGHFKEYKKQLIWGKEEDQRQFYDDSTGICAMELTRRVSCRILAVDAV